MLLKKKLILQFNNIQREMVSAIHDNDRQIKLAVVMGELNAFAKVVAASFPVYLDSMYEKNGEVIDPVIMSDAWRQRAENLKLKLVGIIMKSMEYINELSSFKETEISKANEAILSLCRAQGEIALLLRYEMPWIYSFQDDECGVSLEELMLKTRATGTRQGDYYILTPFWQTSLKKTLPEIECRDTAIVIQGPIDHDNDFTLESLMFYRKIYPHTPIILSTWKGEVSEEFRWMAEAVDICIVESEMPSDRGYLNIKLQLTGSTNGIDFCRNYPEVKYVLKTRTDQRIFLPEFLQYLKNLLKVFKPGDPGMSDRLIFLGGRNSSITSPFVISDFMAFGNIDEMRKLYSASGEHQCLNNDKDNILLENKEIKLERYLYENVQALTIFTKEVQDKYKELDENCLVPESYIIRTYYEEYILGRKLTQNDSFLSHYWKFLKNNAIIVDNSQLMFYWDKYADKYYGFNCHNSDNALDFSVWTSIYCSEIDL